MKKLIYAIKMGIFTFKNPLLYQLGMMNLVKGMFDFLTEVNKNKLPMTCKFTINIEDEPKEILNLWCSPIEGQTPVTRAIELRKELDELKEKLNIYEKREENNRKGKYPIEGEGEE